MTTHDDVGLKRSLDALPREIEPGGQDLWPAIRARMTAAPPGIGSIRTPGHGTAWAPARLRAAALFIVLAASVSALMLSRRAAGQWHLGVAGGGSRLFTVGEALATGGSTARLTVGRIGTVDVAASTDVRLLPAKWSQHRLALTRGTIHARIDAPPRIFSVETPSGTAVDLGCEYTLEVDSLGNSMLVVTAGWVSFEDHGRESLIPAGMRAVTRRGGIVGTPFRDDAPDSLRSALAAFDAGDHGDKVMATVLRSAHPRDAVTLWHLVKRTDSDQRGRVFQRLIQLVPPPVGITSAAVLDDPRMMRLYWTLLPGTSPIVPEWQEKLWRLWLRVTG
jgi:hypothetical protein